MIKPLTYDNVLKLHIEKFLVEPVVTGVNFFEIIESIEQGKPYVEDDVPDGVLI